MYTSIFLLILSNLFMTWAWYGHLKNMSAKPLWVAILASWSIALLEYCFQVPANRIGFRYLTLPQLKIIQECVTLVVFGAFAYYYMGVRLTMNFLYASACMLGAVYFIFRDVKA